MDRISKPDSSSPALKKTTSLTERYEVPMTVLPPGSGNFNVPGSSGSQVGLESSDSEQQARKVLVSFDPTKELAPQHRSAYCKEVAKLERESPLPSALGSGATTRMDRQFFLFYESYLKTVGQSQITQRDAELVVDDAMRYFIYESVKDMATFQQKWTILYAAFLLLHRRRFVTRFLSIC